jgi:hypothetical protein
VIYGCQATRHDARQISLEVDIVTTKKGDTTTETTGVEETNPGVSGATTTKTAAKSPGNKKPRPKASLAKLTGKADGAKAGDVVDAAHQSSSSSTDTDDKPKKILGGKRKAVAVADLKTGEVYPSKSKPGKALAAEFGLDPSDSFVWYKVVKKAPERFDEM